MMMMMMMIVKKKNYFRLSLFLTQSWAHFILGFSRYLRITFETDLISSIIFITRAMIQFNSGIFALYVFYSCITLETIFILLTTVYNTNNYSISIPLFSGFARDIHMWPSPYRFNADFNTSLPFPLLLKSTPLSWVAISQLWLATNNQTIWSVLSVYNNWETKKTIVW